ncbi:MAG: fimbrillin family protein, partial [Segatella copri]
MNKIYLLTAAFAVMASLSGCSDTELASIDTVQEKTPIGFHTVGSQMESRATIINSGDITKTDFKVYAFDGKGNAFMGNNDTDNDFFAHNGVNIKYEAVNSAWTYNDHSNLRYW